MSIFNREEEPKRSIEDILTPKETDADSDEGFTDDDVLDGLLEDEDCDAPVDSAKRPSKPDINPFDCFGMHEDKSDKWLAKCVKVWYYIMSFLWFLFGTMTFAPIIFVRDNIDVVFNNKKKSLLCAIIIHTSLIAILISFIVLTRMPPKS